MGSMLKGEKDLLTLQIKGDGPVRGLTVTANAQGEVKGYAEVPDVILPANEKGKLDVGRAVGRGTLNVIRDMGLKDPYVGQTELITGEIGDDLTNYFAASEQTPSSVGLGVLMEKKQYGAVCGRLYHPAHALCGGGNDRKAGAQPVADQFRDGASGSGAYAGGAAGAGAGRL